MSIQMDEGAHSRKGRVQPGTIHRCQVHQHRLEMGTVAVPRRDDAFRAQGEEGFVDFV